MAIKEYKLTQIVTTLTHSKLTQCFVCKDDFMRGLDTTTTVVPCLSARLSVCLSVCLVKSHLCFFSLWFSMSFSSFGLRESMRLSVYEALPKMLPELVLYIIRL